MIALAAYMYLSDRAASTETAEAERLARLSDAYTQAYAGIAELEVLGGRLAEGERSKLGAFVGLAVMVQEQLALIREIGSPEDRALVDSILDEYLPSLQIVIEVFRSGEGARSSAGALPDVEVAAFLKEALQVPAESRRASFLDSMERLKASQAARSTTTGTVLVAGLLVIVLSVLAIRWFSRAELQAALQLEQLRHSASRDSLTGLGNHRAFFEALARCTALGDSGALVVIDVDRLKEVNDLDGHPAGDGVLRRVADVIAQNGGHENAYRIGGDEFAVLVPQAELAGVVTGIRQSIHEKLDPISVSVGTSTWQSGPVDHARVFGEADSALLWAKRSGRDRWVEAADLDNDALNATSSTTFQGLHAVLRDASLVKAAYQPIWSVEKRIVGYEALARFDAALSFDGPEEAFITAERFGRSTRLDQTCWEVQIAGAAGLPQGMLLFLNVATATLMDASIELAQDLQRRTEQAGLSPGQLVIEISERTPVPVMVLREQIADLRRRGFGVALDDVGAGNAGLEWLKELHFDWIKLDRSMLRSSEQDAARAVFQAILSLARRAHCRVIVEGVETDRDSAWVADQSRLGELPAGHIHMQGFGLGRPVAEPSDFARGVTDVGMYAAREQAPDTASGL